LLFARTVLDRFAAVPFGQCDVVGDSQAFADGLEQWRQSGRWLRDCGGVQALTLTTAAIERSRRDNRFEFGMGDLLDEADELTPEIMPWARR